MRGCIGGVKAAVQISRQAGCLRAIWSGTPWTQSQKYPIGLAKAPSCRVCGAEADTPGHRLHVCPGLRDGFEGRDGMYVPTRLEDAQKWMQDKGVQHGTGCPDYDMMELTVGLPTEPTQLAAPKDVPEVFFWGDWKSNLEDWSDTVFTDGSGYESSIPELCRCGWAAIQVSATGLPLRAVYGTLPGDRQTVGRAERYAILQALIYFPMAKLVVSDLLDLVEEGNSWDILKSMAGCKYADLWRTMMLKFKAPPKFAWTPAHKEVED